MSSNSIRNPSRKVAFLGVMTAAALMLSYIESLFILVPGIRGLNWDLRIWQWYCVYTAMAGRKPFF